MQHKNHPGGGFCKLSGNQTRQSQGGARSTDAPEQIEHASGDVRLPIKWL
jgi:hypothetical protein